MPAIDTPSTSLLDIAARLPAPEPWSPPEGDLAAAVREWSRALGGEHVDTREEALARRGRSTGGRPVPPVAILSPGSAEEVQEVVRIAGRHRIPLHPISRGRNWGYGDACPPGPGQALVDLRRMNRVLEVHRELAYCVIEPGVTQRELAAALEGSGLWMDATGAGLEASVVGNSLDRGFGHTPYGDHFANTCGLEVVLPDASLLRTGYGHYADARARWAYRYGVGPVLDGLFSQSGGGIVTRIGLWLMPVPEAFSAFFICAERDEDLPEIVDALRPLRLHEVLRSAVHIANDLRAISARCRYPWERTGGATPLPAHVRAALRAEHGVGAWNVAGALYGTRAGVAAARGALRRAVGGRWRVVLLDERKLAWAERLGRVLGWLGRGEALRRRVDIGRDVLDVLRGVPTDGALPGACWRVRGPLPSERPDPLDARAGLLWMSPVAPATGEAAREVMDIVTPIYEAHGFEALVTFTMITPRALCCVTNVAFDRGEPEESARALACYDALAGALAAGGYHPYRTGPAGWGKLARGSTVFWETARKLRAALDPDGLISPGRYDPLAPRA
ncbi:MAG: FAD-binding oxidoreductase [Planctomycetes bacterium]|nr:FAD-binding oxidoreductase [Planctomycetota bacterium]